MIIHISAQALGLVLIVASTASAQGEPCGASPYLGQAAPGQTPVAFAPGLVSTPGYEYSGVFSPDMSEFYFIRGTDTGSGQEFVVVSQEQGCWQETVLSERVGQPFVSPDGETLHLGARYMNRAGSGWSQIASLPPEFQAYDIMRLTSSNHGTYVFDEIGMPGGDGVLRSSRLHGDVRLPAQALPPQINAGLFNAHPFIAPDESFILWDGRREEGQGNSDIYVSFRRADGEWGEALNLGGRVNTGAWEASATVSPDGRYLFFNRMISESEEGALPDVDIMWVDAQVLYDLRPE